MQDGGGADLLDSRQARRPTRKVEVPGACESSAHRSSSALQPVAAGCRLMLSALQTCRLQKRTLLRVSQD